MADQQTPDPAPAGPPSAAEAAAAFTQATGAPVDEGHRTLMAEAGPMAPADFFDPHITNEAQSIESIFGLPSAGSQGGNEDAGGAGGAPSQASAAGEGGGGQAPAPPQGPPPPASPPAGATAQPSPTPQPGHGSEPLPPVPGAAPVAPAAPAQPSAVTPPPAQPAYDPRELELASLRAQVAQLQQALQPAQPGAPQPQPGQPGTQGQPQAGQAPQYGLQVPREHLELIQGDDPQRAQMALSDLINQSLAHVHQRVMADVAPLIQNQLQTFRATLQSEQTTNSAIEDYYSNFKEHRTPAVMPIVAQEVYKMQQEFPGAPWNETYRNALGARVNAVLQQLSGQAPAPAPAPPNGAAGQPRPITPPVAHLPQQPAPMLPGGPRPAQGGTDPGDFMYETFAA